MLHLALSYEFIKTGQKNGSSLLVQRPVLLPGNKDFVDDCYLAQLAMTLETMKLLTFWFWFYIFKKIYALYYYYLQWRIKFVCIVTVDRIEGIGFQAECPCLCLKEEF